MIVPTYALRSPNFMRGLYHLIKQPKIHNLGNIGLDW